MATFDYTVWIVIAVCSTLIAIVIGLETSLPDPEAKSSCGFLFPNAISVFSVFSGPFTAKMPRKTTLFAAKSLMALWCYAAILLSGVFAGMFLQAKLDSDKFGNSKLAGLIES